jgi:hypothetical protein
MPNSNLLRIVSTSSFVSYTARLLNDVDFRFARYRRILSERYEFNVLARCAVATAFIIAVVAAPSRPALACPGWGWLSTIFFEESDLATDLDAPVIADIMIISVSESGAIAIAKINRIIKGEIKGSEIRIAVPQSSCDFGVVRGARGIVIGAIATDIAGNSELVAIAESNIDRGLRRRKRPDTSKSR